MRSRAWEGTKRHSSRYDVALALRPRLAEGEFAAGFALARLGRTKEAETRYRRAVAARPDFAAAWVNLGALLREQGKDVSSEAALRRAVGLRPDLVSAWLNLAALERERCRPEVAETYLHKAFALNSSQVETLVAWCQLRIAERDLAGAWGWLRWALVRNPDFDDAVNLHGILLHWKGDFERRSKPSSAPRRWAIARRLRIAAIPCSTWAAWRQHSRRTKPRSRAIHRARAPSTTWR